MEEHSSLLLIASRARHTLLVYIVSKAPPFNKTKPVQGGGGFFLTQSMHGHQPQDGGATQSIRRNSVFAVNHWPPVCCYIAKSASIRRRPVLRHAHTISKLVWLREGGRSKFEMSKLARRKGRLSYFSRFCNVILIVHCVFGRGVVTP